MATAKPKVSAQTAARTEISTWLAVVKMPQYVSVFRKAGFNDLKDLVDMADRMSLDDLKAIGIASETHRRRILQVLEVAAYWASVNDGKIDDAPEPSHMQPTQSSLHRMSHGGLTPRSKPPPSPRTPRHTSPRRAASPRGRPSSRAASPQHYDYDKNPIPRGASPEVQRLTPRISSPQMSPRRSSQSPRKATDSRH